jgi:hypothetical protein
MSRSSSRPGARVRMGWISFGLALAVAAMAVTLAVASRIPAAPGSAHSPAKVTVTDHTKVLNVLGTGMDDPGRHELTSYAPEVGKAAIGAGDEREDLRLGRVARLSPAAMAFVPIEALAPDRRGARLRGDVHGRAPPVELDHTGPAAP